MKKFTFFFIAIAVMAFVNLSAQKPLKNKGIFKEYAPGYFQDQILKGIEEFEKKDVLAKPDLVFKMDFSAVDIPKSTKDFTSFWHNPPISQGNTGTCWCFSSTSFFESEIYRLTSQQVKLSEMYTVYYEYVERAVTFVQTRGKSAFAQGSEANAVPKIWRKYGIVPLKEYTGMLPGQKFHAHDAMFDEMMAYLKYVKTNNAWNQDQVVETIKNILNHYMGMPPAEITVDGKTISPIEYLNNVLKLNLSDYMDVMSLMQQSYWQKVEYEVTDNWWHSKDYYNIPLDDYMKVIKRAVKAGYPVCIGGDVSEAGFDARDYQAAVVPSFDIPSAYIDEYARQFRFSNKTTTDDHGLHIVGYLEKDNGTWFLMKDSGSGSRTGGETLNKNFGYYFFHEDYIKLKMMDILVHKDMLDDLFKKFE